ncbi:MAG TPA: mechanosensitive ion channel family protein [Opitutaceae bacterium]|nr:mechanosensitive ion channel family protein [Opitutaceae bacterium]
MQLLRILLVALTLCNLTSLRADPPAADAQTQAPAQANAPAPASASTSDAKKADAQAHQNSTNAVAAQEYQKKHVSSPAADFLEHLTDSILQRFDIDASGNTPTRYIIAAALVVIAFLLRRVVILIVFGIARKLSARTKTTLDDKLFPRLETPVAAFIVVAGIVAGLKVLKLSAQSDDVLDKGATMAFSLVVFWFLLRAFSTVLDHAEEVSRGKGLGIAAFMPWIKKTLVTVFVIFGVLMVAQSQGLDVKAFLAGLGIGGLAFALAAQDTIANLFGSVVVAIDQPFKLGEFVQIGANSGSVEDIGLRSTRLRRADKALVVIPNKTVAAEAITNLSRFTQRRVEQNIGITYDATGQQMDELVAEIRRLILEQPEIDKTSVMVGFNDFTASSLNVWIVYMTISPDFGKHLEVRQRLNVLFMRAVEARGLEFAFPTQTVHFEANAALRLATEPKADENPRAKG